MFYSHKTRKKIILSDDAQNDTKTRSINEEQVDSISVEETDCVNVTFGFYLICFRFRWKNVKTCTTILTL